MRWAKNSELYYDPPDNIKCLEKKTVFMYLKYGQDTFKLSDDVFEEGDEVFFVLVSPEAEPFNEFVLYLREDVSLLSKYFKLKKREKGIYETERPWVALGGSYKVWLRPEGIFGRTLSGSLQDLLITKRGEKTV